VNAKLYRYVFWPLWFFAVPLALATATVWLLGAGEEALPTGAIGRFRWFVQDQKVPAIIVFFTLFEMGLYHFRHSLPLADRMGVAGRAGLPPDLRRDYEQAGQLVDEARRILKKHKQAVQREIPAKHRDALAESLVALEASMTAEPFDSEAFEQHHQRTAELVDRHLARWQRGEIREYAESILIAVGVALMLRAFVVEAFKIPSGSMLPTLQIQDHIFVNKFAYGPNLPFTKTRVLPDLPPKRGDVIVFEYPDPNPRAPSQDFIKRVIALPGDTLEVEGGHPIINGWKVPRCRVGDYRFNEGEPGYEKQGGLYVEFLGDYSYLTLFEDENLDEGEGFTSRRTLQGPYRVDEGEVWVLGDNRNNSSDSRAWRQGRGAGVPFDNIKGRALFVWLSFNNRGEDLLGVTWDRLFVDVMGKPRLPKEAEQSLVAGIERCLQERPSETLPPPPRPLERRAESPAAFPTRPR
jgi:signal peptidase I